MAKIPDMKNDRWETAMAKYHEMNRDADYISHMYAAGYFWGQQGAHWRNLPGGDDPKAEAAWLQGFEDAIGDLTPDE